METDRRRSWTLDTARAMLAEVRERTGSAATEVEGLLERRAAAAEGSDEHREIEGRIRTVINGWVRAMEALGVEVKGLWLVDFDNGDGYYCWRWPEGSLEYFHGYDEGFAGRCRIQ